MSEQSGSEPTVPQAGEPVAPPPSDPEPSVPPPAPPAPLVAWDAPATLPPSPLVEWAPPSAAPPGGGAEGTYADAPPFTVGALLSDTFARYGADFLRLFIVAAATSGLSWLSSFASLPAPGSSPFVRPTGFVDVSGILGLVSFVIGLVGSATIFALAEGGPGLPFTRGIRRGIERAGWVFLTSLILVVAFIAVFLLALIPTALLAIMSPSLAIIPILLLVLVFIWASLRLSLALPANVADNLNSIEAVKLSWRVTRPAAVWGRILAAAFLFGLLFVPAAIGSMLLVFPAMFGAMFGSTTGGLPVSVVFLVPAIVFAIFTPLTALLSFSAYRRLVPPFQPSWTALPAPPAPPAVAAVSAVPVVPVAPPFSPPPGAPPPEALAAPAATAAAAPAATAPEPPAATAAAADAATALATPTAPRFHVPRLGTAGKALLALVVLADLAGVVAIPYGLGEMERFVRDFRGFPGFSPGTGLPNNDSFVAPGLVTFSSDVDLDACTAAFPFFIASPTSEVKWLAIPRTRVTPQDEVFVRITRDGRELETTLQDPGTYECLGSEEPIADLHSGVYTYELIVNGSSGASGTLIVQ